MTYWQRRQKEQLKALEKSEKALMQRLTAYYRDEYAKLDKEIASFYSKYGVKKIVEYRMLLEDLSPQDRSLLIKNVEDFKEKYPNLKHIVPIRENIYKLNRLEGLQLSIIMQQAEIGAVNEQAVRRHLENLALKNANSVAELLGFGKNFYFENSDIIKNFVGVKWCDGKNFSQRIWENTDKLARYLTTDLAQGFARGESYEKLTTQIGKRFIDVAKRDIYRLVYTEGTYIMAESSAKPFEEDFENYRLSTVGDGKVCPICTSVAENVFRFADREPGVNFPPMHPMCRCTFEIVVDDWNKWLDDYEKKHLNNKENKGEYLKSRLKDDKMYSVSFRAQKIEHSLIENIANVKINGLNEEECREITQMRKRLLNRMVNEPPGIEGGLSIPLNDKQNAVFSMGTLGNVDVKDLNSLYYAIHNHPHSDCLSPPDLINFLKRSHMYGIEAIGNDCVSGYSITKTPQANIEGYRAYIINQVKNFNKSNPNLDVLKNERDYKKAVNLSESILERARAYGFKITKF